MNDFFDGASLHDPYYHEPYDYEDRYETNSAPTLEIYLRGNGAHLYNPLNNNQVFSMTRDGSLIDLSLLTVDGKRVSTLGTYTHADEIIEDFPEFGAQKVYPGPFPLHDEH